MKRSLAFTVFSVSLLLSITCQSADQTKASESTTLVQKAEANMPEIKVSSPAFVHEGMIPARYTCDGDDTAPEITWKNIPEKTKTLALICDDPDAPHGTWVHWVVYNIPASHTSIATGTPSENKPFIFGKNSWGKTSYGGPCPPGGTHRYYFKLYALDADLKPKPGATKEELLKAMEGHILAQGELMGKYQRQK